MLLGVSGAVFAESGSGSDGTDDPVDSDDRVRTTDADDEADADNETDEPEVCDDDEFLNSAGECEDLEDDVDDEDENETEDDDEDEIEVEVEIENGIAYIEVEANGEEWKLELNETDRGAILDAIVDETGLTMEEILANLEFEVSDSGQGRGRSGEERFEYEYVNEEGERVRVRLRYGDGDFRQRIEVDGEEYEYESRVRLKDENGSLIAELSNGRNALVKVMPNVASERALEQLRLKVCVEENNCTLELKEVGQNNDSLSYELQVERHYRILGMFKAKAREKVEIDAETGEIKSRSRAWWRWLAASDDSEEDDDTPENNETEVENETETCEAQAIPTCANDTVLEATTGEDGCMDYACVAIDDTNSTDDSTGNETNETA